MNSSSRHWVIRPELQPAAQARLFCLPYAGGGSTPFRSWSTSLQHIGVEVCPILLPGREDRIAEPAFHSLDLLVQELAEVLQPYLDLPFAFFGHSMGALISFELARQLRRQGGHHPAHLFLSSHRAAQLPDRSTPIRLLPDGEFIEEMRKLNGIPSEVVASQELLRLIMPTLRADITLCETYLYTDETPLDCGISAFGGRQDSTASYQELVAWKEQTCRSFSIHLLPGDHFYLRTSSALLLDLLAQHLRHLVWWLGKNSQQ